MESISFRCTSCKQNLKVGADKAGRKIKCTKCATEVTVPRGDAEAIKAAPPAPAKPADKKPDEESKGYALIPMEVKKDGDTKEAEKPKKKDAKQKAAPLKRKYKTLAEPELWEKVKSGLQIMMIGVNIWGGALFFMVLIVFLGILAGPEYAEVVENAMTVKANSPAGEVTTVDRPTALLGMVTGTTFQGIGRIFYILATVLTLFQIIVMMAGYAMCLQVPDRFGARGQVTGLIAMGSVNFLLTLLFKLGPAIGVLNYVLIPYALPEISLLDANIDRDPPLWIAWSGAPLWECLLSVVFICCTFAEPTLVGIFIWSIGASLREEPIITQGQGVVNLSLGIGFGFIAYTLITMTGTSGVALIVIRVIYGGLVFFMILLVIRIPMTLHFTRSTLDKFLESAAQKEEDAEAKEEEEEKEAKKEKSKSKGKAKAAKDEDDDDDEDEDDDDEDD